MGKCVTNTASTTDWPHLVASLFREEVEKQFQWKPEAVRQKSNSMENFRTGAGTRVLIAIFMSPTVLWRSSAICMRQY